MNKTDYMTIEFKDCKETFVLCDEGKHKVDGSWSKYEVYGSSFKNNFIVFERFDLSKVDINEIEISDEISGSIRTSAYDYLMNILNKNDNVVVYWTQVEGTTSDYTIYYDINHFHFSDYKNLDKTMCSINKGINDDITGYKYKEYRDGKISKVQC